MTCCHACQTASTLGLGLARAASSAVLERLGDVLALGLVGGSVMASSLAPVWARAALARSSRLAALVGPQRVKEMLLLAKLIDAPTALQIGLISELLPDVAALHARAGELAKTLAGHAPITMAVTKEALRRLQAKMGAESIDDLIRHTYGSADFREGMDAFLGKRPPKWTGT